MNKMEEVYIAMKKGSYETYEGSYDPYTVEYDIVERVFLHREDAERFCKESNDRANQYIGETDDIPEYYIRVEPVFESLE